MITRLRVKNYRSLANVEVELAPLTVLVGHNGSGKSNLVDVLRFIQDALRGLDAAIVKRHGMSALRRWSDKGRPYDIEIALSIKTAEISGAYSFLLGSERRGEYRVKREECLLNEQSGQLRTVTFQTDNGNWVRKPEQLTPVLEANTLVLPIIAQTEPYNHLYNFISNMGFYNIYPNALAEPQKPTNPYPLDELGRNLASTLRELQRTKSHLLPQLEQAIQTILPDVVGVQVAQVGGYLVTRLRHEVAITAHANFELSQESDGTLRMLGLLTALYQDPPRTLIVLEEPELTIHPDALRVLWEEIESAADRSQILLTTHSPDLLDLCKVEHLRVVEKTGGITEIGPVDETQKAAIQQRLFTPGELLRAQGLRRASQLELVTEDEAA